MCGRAGTGTNYRTFSFSQTSSGYWTYSHFEYRNLDASRLCCPEDVKMPRVLLFIEQGCMVFRIFLELQIIHSLYFARGILCFEGRVVAWPGQSKYGVYLQNGGSMYFVVIHLFLLKMRKRRKYLIKSARTANVS